MPETLKISCYHCGQKLDVGELEPFSRIACPVCNTRIIVPKPFGNLLLEEHLGTGGMADVYRAMDITLDRDIAVKVLRPEFARDPEVGRLFISEARSASAINHPNIIPIYSCGEMDEKTYIIMQFMEGGSLLRRLRQGLPAERQTARWFAETAKGLDSAHLHGVAHHNVKPANIFLDSDGNVKVGDFGLANVANRGRPCIENDQVPAWVSLELSQYVSPERISTGRQDVAGDLYSLGAALYHVLCGVPPFNERTAAENLRARFSGPPTAPRQRREDLSPEMSDFCLSLLSLYPSERPRSYAQVAAALTDLAGSSRRGAAPERTVAAKGDEEAEAVRSLRPVQAAAAAKPKPRARKKAISMHRPPPVVAAGEPPPPPSLVRRLLHWIPLLVILVVAVLATAHYKRVSWYQENILPFIQRVFRLAEKPDDQPPAKPAAAPAAKPADKAGPGAEEKPAAKPSTRPPEAFPPAR